MPKQPTDDLPTSIKLPPDIKAALKAAAKQHDMTVSSVIRQVLRAWFANLKGSAK